MDPDVADSPPPHLLQTAWIMWREGGADRPSAETTAEEWCNRLNFSGQMYFSRKFLEIL